MELTKEQLLQIDNYVFVSGIKYYDVRTEIVDHFASVLEQKLDENPDLNFKKEIHNTHRNFSNRGFQKLLEQKTKAVRKRFYKASFKHLITFFKFPKIIISGLLFYVLYLLMNMFENKRTFFILLIGLGFLLVMSIFVRIYVYRKQKKKTFLALDMNNNFLQIFNLSIVYFNSVTQFRTAETFTGLTAMPLAEMI